MMIKGCSDEDVTDDLSLFIRLYPTFSSILFQFVCVCVCVCVCATCQVELNELYVPHNWERSAATSCVSVSRFFLTVIKNSSSPHTSFIFLSGLEDGRNHPAEGTNSLFRETHNNLLFFKEQH